MIGSFILSLSLLAGDFNCVQTPLLDKLGGTPSERTEIESLSRLVKTAQSTNARVQLGFALNEIVLSPQEYFTFWRGEVVSRID